MQNLIKKVIVYFIDDTSLMVDAKGILHQT